MTASIVTAAILFNTHRAAEYAPRAAEIARYCTGANWRQGWLRLAEINGLRDDIAAAVVSSLPFTAPTWAQLAEFAMLTRRNYDGIIADDVIADIAKALTA